MNLHEHQSVTNETKAYINDVAPDVTRVKTSFANVYIIGTSERWVLIDAGLPGYASKIISHAEDCFGKGTKPEGIILTHGHFDHVGALETLLNHWDVPVYAHTLEIPYLTGLSNYPPPDPAIGGGAIAYMSWVFPISPLNLKGRIIELREGSFIPDLPDWKVIHTPGHSPGHISLFREHDGVLIAGDAFVTVDQNSLSAVISQKKELHGPPAYFTCDWTAARRSVEKLHALHPQIAACGHGIPMSDYELTKGLRDLTDNFEKLSIPSKGRYVKKAAKTNRQGIVEMPTPISFYAGRVLGIAVLSSIIGLAAYKFSRRN